jgi:predicted nucleic acid-binding protein
MILADTSVWVDHLRRRNSRFESLLMSGEVITHETVIGELACGNLPDRAATLGLLRSLHRGTAAETEEVLILIERHRLMGLGLGWSDVQILASALLDQVQMWTLDKRLDAAARRLRVDAVS